MESCFYSAARGINRATPLQCGIPLQCGKGGTFESKIFLTGGAPQLSDCALTPDGVGWYGKIVLVIAPVALPGSHSVLTFLGLERES